MSVSSFSRVRYEYIRYGTRNVLDTVPVPETHKKRQATQHGCLPSLLCDGDKGIEIVYSEEKNSLYWAY
jgi:hypothetical protein